MKLKFPKKITIGDTEFEIKTDHKSEDASFYYWDGDKENSDIPTKAGRITIGTRFIKINPIRVLTAIIHELKEIIQVEQGTRLNSLSEKYNYQFHYAHREHTDLCSRLAGLLKEFIV